MRAQPTSTEGKKTREMRQPSLPHNRIGQDWNADRPPGYPRRPPRWPSKVPEVITIYFWVAKLLTTALGESTSDALVFGINKYLAVGIGFVGLVVALILQFAVRRYIPWVYWFTVTMVAIFGTMAADVFHIVILTPIMGASQAYLFATVLFAACLVVVFSCWYLVERSLSIHSITTVRREVFYWATVMVTFALGTACGDMTGHYPQAGVLSLHLPVRHLDRVAGSGLLAAGPERDRGLLAGIHPDSAAGSLDRRLAGQAYLRGRCGTGRCTGCPRSDHPDHRRGWLPGFLSPGSHQPLRIVASAWAGRSRPG